MNFHTVCRTLWPTSPNGTPQGARKTQIQACTLVWKRMKVPFGNSRIHRGSWAPCWDCGPGHSLLVISSARLVLGIAESHSRREPRAPGALGRSQLAADTQALPQPPLYSLLQITVIFFFSSLPMWHFTRNLTDLTSHWEKVYHWGRKPSQPIRFSHTSRLHASCLPGVTRGREEMSTHSAFTFLYNCLCYFHIV